MTRNELVKKLKSIKFRVGNKWVKANIEDWENVAKSIQHFHGLNALYLAGNHKYQWMHDWITKGYHTPPKWMYPENINVVKSKVLYSEQFKCEISKVELSVYLTKKYFFRAHIQEITSDSIDLPPYEVTVGGKSWIKGKGRQYEKQILAKVDDIANLICKRLTSITDSV